MKHDCIFCRIVRGEIPSRKVYEDDDILAFHDINPATPVHFLIIPKVHVENASTLEDQCISKYVIRNHCR